MKITYFTRKPFDGQFSIERVFAQLIPKIAERHSTAVYECSKSSKGLISRWLNIYHARKHQSDINHITGDVHYLALGLKKSKTILTIHDLAFMNHANPIAKFVLWLFWVYLPIRRVRMVTTVSNATRVDIVKYGRIPSKRIRVVPNYIDPNFQWKPKEFDCANPTILLIGTNPNKNLERVIEALSGVVCQVRIIGKLNSIQLHLLTKYQIKYSNAFNLSDEDIRKEYEHCDLLVFCSTSEGFGLPILEAQATGRAVVTSTISSTAEIAEKSACLVDPFDVQSVQDGILKVITNKSYRDELIDAGRENIKRFSLDQIVEMYLDVYEEIQNS